MRQINLKKRNFFKQNMILNEHFKTSIDIENKFLVKTVVLDGENYCFW